MTLTEAKKELEKFVKLKTTMRPAFVDVLLQAEEVVRCKDCKYYLNSNEKCGLVDTRLHFYETDKSWTEDCFCSWGERREDEID